MKNILFIFCFLLCITCSFAQLHVRSTHFIGGDGCPSDPFDAIPTKDKGILFTGRTNCKGGGYMPSTPHAWENVLIGKLDSNLSLEWLKIYGGNFKDWGYAICEANDGGYAILCYTFSSDGDVPNNQGGNDLWLIKIDAQGNKLWSQTYGGPASDEPLSIALAADNGFIILGASTGAGGDVPVHYTSSPFSYDWLVIKTDSLGNKQWSKTIGGNGDERPWGRILTANDGYYLAGSSESVDHDCTDTMWHIGTPTSYDFYLLKLDTAGNVQWAKSYGSTNTDAIRTAMLDDRDSSIVMVGYSSGINYMATGNHGDLDMWVVKADKQGNMKWAKMLGDVSEDIGTSILKGRDNGYVVCGTSISYLSTQINPRSIGNLDPWVFILDNSANVLTDKVFGGLLYESLDCIIPFEDGVVATGSSISSSFTEGSNVDHIGQSSNIFFTKIDYFPVSVSQNSQNAGSALRVYPNPARNDIHIQLPGGSCQHISITDITGRQLFAKTTSETKLHLDVSLWPRGIYYLQIKNPNNAQTQKLLLQ